jgi:hypothetical protein
MSSSFQVPSSPNVLEDTVTYAQRLSKAHQLKQWFADQENMPRIQAIFNTQPLMVLGQTIVKYLGIHNSLYDQTAKLTEMINQLADLLIQTPQYEAFALSMEASTRHIIQPSYTFNPKMVTLQPRTMTPPPPPPPLETPVPTDTISIPVYILYSNALPRTKICDAITIANIIPKLPFTCTVATTTPNSC